MTIFDQLSEVNITRQKLADILEKNTNTLRLWHKQGVVPAKEQPVLEAILKACKKDPLLARRSAAEIKEVVIPTHASRSVGRPAKPPLPVLDHEPVVGEIYYNYVIDADTVSRENIDLPAALDHPDVQGREIYAFVRAAAPYGDLRLGFFKPSADGTLHWTRNYKTHTWQLVPPSPNFTPKALFALFRQTNPKQAAELFTPPPPLPNYSPEELAAERQRVAAHRAGSLAEFSRPGYDPAVLTDLHEIWAAQDADPDHLRRSLRDYRAAQARSTG